MTRYGRCCGGKLNAGRHLQHCHWRQPLPDALPTDAGQQTFFCEKELGCMFTASSLIKPPAYAPVPSALSFCAGKPAPRYQGIERCDFDGSWDGTGPLAGAPTQ